MGINVLDGAGGYDGKVSPRYLQRVVNRIVRYIADVTATPADSRPYKVYSALISQTGTDDPVVETAFENTIGDIVWERQTTGVYYGTLADAFVTNKTQCFVSSSYVDIPALSGGWLMADSLSEDVVQITAFGLDSGTFQSADNIVSNIEIRVYD